MPLYNKYGRLCIFKLCIKFIEIIHGLYSVIAWPPYRMTLRNQIIQKIQKKIR
jgi:hypothetical protein